MKKIICLCLIMCLISVSFMLPVYVEAGSDSSLECGGCVLPDDGEESYTPPQKYQWGRFI
jgi:hypothetical protein